MNDNHDPETGQFTSGSGGGGGGSQSTHGHKDDAATHDQIRVYMHKGRLHNEPYNEDKATNKPYQKAVKEGRLFIHDVRVNPDGSIHNKLVGPVAPGRGMSRKDQS